MGRRVVVVPREIGVYVVEPLVAREKCVEVVWDFIVVGRAVVKPIDQEVEKRVVKSLVVTRDDVDGLFAVVSNMIDDLSTPEKLTT